MRDRSSGVLSRWLLTRWLPLPALFTLSAAAGGGCSGSADAGLTALGTCATSAQCSADQECSANLCVNIARCETAAACPVGQTCVAKICRATCSSDDQCAPLKLSCDPASGVCLPTPSDTSAAGGGGAAAGGAGGAADGGTNALGGAAASGGSLIASASSDSGGNSSGGASPGGTGGGSAGNTSIPPPEVTELIDDLEDGDTAILPLSGRSGHWYFYNHSGDNTAGDIQQSIDPTFEGANQSKYSIETKGGPLSGDSGQAFAGLALDFNNQGTTPTHPSRKPYDVSAWEGISFWAKGNLPNESVRVELATVAIAAPDQGGTCTDGACYDWYGKQLALTGEWSKYHVRFADLAQAGWGSKQELDLSTALGMNFKYSKPSGSFDFAIDEIALYRGGTSAPNKAGGNGGACVGPGGQCF